jgi:hypothetical protein
MNVKKTKVMKITKQTSPVQSMINYTAGEYGIFQLFG